LGHRRLSIIDLSTMANQPMISADGNQVISYNGEVYNFRDLTAQLALKDLRTHSDTEVVLRAFAEQGAASFRMLNGMFAFAIYDKRAQSLWLVRDRLGIKPLYYALLEDGLYFGSEIKVILGLAAMDPVCDVSRLHEWLYYGNTLGGKTLYRSIQQLPPAHYLQIDLKSFRHVVRPYWTLAEQSKEPPLRGSASDVVAETRRLLDAAVRRQLISDVPVGVFLSGGVDSSTITALASRHYSGQLSTYSAGFDDLAGVDERPKARRVAAHFGTDHHELHITGADVAALVEKMVRHHDMPFCDSANIPLYLMASQISGHTKVVLQGDGGDEVFGGYRRYVSLRHRWILRAMSRLYSALPGRAQSPFRRRVRRYLGAFAANDVATTMARLLTPLDPSASPEAIFSAELRRKVEKADPFARYRECQPMFAGQDIVNEMSFVDMMIELPDIFLEKVDRATMAASLEVRVPFLDHEIVDSVARIPGSRKMPNGRKKWLLKKAVRGLVPDFVLSGPKTGFSVPFGYWLRTSLKPMFFDHLETIDRRRPGIVDRDAVIRQYAAMESGNTDLSYTLWNLLNLMVWVNDAKIEFASEARSQDAPQAMVVTP
jgi:asparagine synthase (glutamine-hydrolysing)